MPKAQIEYEAMFALLKSLSMFDNNVFWLRSADYKDQLYVAPSCPDIYGQSCNQLYQAPASWGECIYDEDKKSVFKAISHRKQVLMSGQRAKPLFYRVQLPNGRTNFIKNHSHPIIDNKNRILGFYGFSELLTYDHWRDLMNRDESHKMEDALNHLMPALIKNFIPDHKAQELILPETKPIIQSGHQHLWDLLSLREQETLKLLLKGLTAKESAKELSISPRTIEAHINSIKRKFHCDKKIEILSKLI